MIVSPSVFLRGDSGNNVLRVFFGAFAEAESKNYSKSLDDDECAGNYGYHSDSDLEQDEDSSEETSRQTEPIRGHPFDPFCFAPTENESKPTYGEYTECLEKGKTVKIQDMAFVTYIISNPHYSASDGLTDSRHFCCISTPIRSSSRPTDRRTIASREVLRSFPSRRTRSLDHPQNQFIGSQTRFPPHLLYWEKV